MAFDVQAARSAGYSDGEIASFLAEDSKFDLSAAQKAGYAPSEIIDFLTAAPAKAVTTAKPAETAGPQDMTRPAGALRQDIAPASAPAPATEEGPSFLSTVVDKAGSLIKGAAATNPVLGRALSIAQGPQEKKINSVLEGKQMPGVPFDAAEAERLSRRDYAEQREQEQRIAKSPVIQEQRAPILNARQKFAEQNPVTAGFAQSAASTLAGTLNAPAAAAGLAGDTVNRVAQSMGVEAPVGRVGNMPLVDDLKSVGQDYASQLSRKSPGKAWDDGDFGRWMLTQLSGNSFSAAQSLGALFVPGAQASLLASMGGISAGNAYSEGDSGSAAALKGLVEVGSEMLPLKAADKIKDLVLAIPGPARNQVLAEAGKRLLAAGTAVTTNSLVGAIEEVAAEIGGNAVDKFVSGKDKSLFEDVDRAAIVGAAFGTGFSAPAVRDVLSGPQATRSRELAAALRQSGADPAQTERTVADMLRTEQSGSVAINPAATSISAAQAQRERQQQSIAQIGAATNVDEAIAAAAEGVSGPVPTRVEPATKNQPTAPSTDDLIARIRELEGQAAPANSAEAAIAQVQGELNGNERVASGSPAETAGSSQPAGVQDSPVSIGQGAGQSAAQRVEPLREDIRSTAESTNTQSALTSANPAALIALANNPTSPLAQQAAAELRRRETDYAYQQRSEQEQAQRQVEERALLDEAADQQIAQSQAVNEARTDEAPTAMQVAMERARGGQTTQAEPQRQATQRPAAAGQSSQYSLTTALNPSGTLTIRGGGQDILQRLANAGISSVLTTRNGLVVPRGQAVAAERAVQQINLDLREQQRADSQAARTQFQEAERKRTAGGNAARSNANQANPFKAFIAKHGIALDQRREFAPGVTEQRKAMVQGYGPIFRKSGQPLDKLANMAVDEGFLSSPDEAKLYSMITDAINGTRIIPQYTAAGAQTEMESRIARQQEYEQEAAEALAELRDGEIFDLEDSDIVLTANSNTSTADFLRSLGANEQEIQDAINEEQNAARGTSPEEAFRGQAQGVDSRREVEAGPVGKVQSSGGGADGGDTSLSAIADAIDASNPDNGKDPLTEKVYSSVSNGKQAVEWLQANAKNPWHRQIAEWIRPYIPDGTGVQFLRKGDKVRNEIATRLNAGAMAVAELNTDGGYKMYFHTDKNINESILLHELIHVATMQALKGTKNAALRADLQNILAGVRRTLKETQFAPMISDSGLNATRFFDGVLVNEDELLAYAFSSPALRQFMQRMNADGKFIADEKDAGALRRRAERRLPGVPPVTLWQKFTDAIRRFLGIPPRNQLEFERLISDREEKIAGIVQSGQDTRLYDILENLMQQAMDAQAFQSADHDDGALAFAYSNTNPGAANMTSATDWQMPELTRIDRLLYETQDQKVDLKRTQEAIRDAGRQIEERFDARTAETLYAGRVAYRSEQFLNAEAKPLLQAMTLAKVGMDELADYLHARGAEERNAQIAKVNPDMPDGGAGTNTKGALLTNQTAQDYLAAVPADRRKVLDALAKRVDAITKGTRELLVNEGIEKREVVDAWEKAYKNYVPMFRDEAESGELRGGGGGFNVRGANSQRATGSTKQVTNILAHVLMQREAAITRAEKNRVGMSLYGLALTNPNRDVWTTIRPGMQAAQIAADLKAMGVDPVVAEAGMAGVPTIRTVDPITNTVVDRANPMYKNLPGAIILKVGGEDRVLLLNEKDPRALRMAQALKNLDGLTNFDLAGSFVGQTTRWLAAVNTQYNPAFGLVNGIRDTFGGAINLTSTELKGQSAKVLFDAYTKAGPGIVAAMRGNTTNPWAKLYEQFQEDGGKTGYREVFRTAEDRTKAIEAELKNLDSQGKLTPRKAAQFTFQLLDNFNTAIENAVRLSAYKAALDHGLSRPKAAKLARELTVDFNRKGRLGREVGPLYAFFNASVQGTARTVEALKGPTGAKIIAGGLALGAAQAIMLALAGFDEDEVPEFIKARALIIPILGGKEKRFVAIPLPLGLHVLPNTGRVIADLALGGGKDAGKKTFSAIGEVAGAFNPLGGGNIFTADGALRTALPTIVDPIVEMGFNKNFAGNAIEKQARGEGDVRPGFARVKESTQRSVTGQAYLGISKALNKASGGSDYEAGLASPSPEMVQYVAHVAGGGLLREIEKIINISGAEARGDKVPASKMPVLGRLYGEVDADAVEKSRYFEATKKIMKAKAAETAARKSGDARAIQKMYDERAELLSVNAQREIGKSISDLNKLAIDPARDPEELRAIDQARIARMRALNQVIRSIEEQKISEDPSREEPRKKLQRLVKREEVSQ